MLSMAQQRFGETLRQLRTKAGLSKYALAKRSGITAQAISYLELSEREPTWGTVIALARALGVSVEAFDVDDEEKPKKKGKGK